MNLTQLAKYIAYMVNNGDYVAGHAIFQGRDDSSPSKILKEGLIIEDESSGLSFTTRQFEPKFEDCLENIIDLSINCTGFIIIISIPRELLMAYNSKYFDSCNNSSIVLQSTGKESKYYKDIFGNPTKIALLPAIYVLGYINIQKNIFIQNPNYGFNSDRKQNIINLKSILDKRYEKILKEKEFILTKSCR